MLSLSEAPLYMAGGRVAMKEMLNPRRTER